MAARRGGHVPPAVENLLGPLEAACLRVLWQRSPASVGEVLHAVNQEQDSELAYTTIMTVLARLNEKGYMKRERQGRAYQYRPG